MDGVFRAGCSRILDALGVPLLGWRTQFGGTVFGWHDRVLTEAKLCLAKQITNSDKLVPKRMKKTASPASRWIRAVRQGRVDIYQPWHYDMQSQFFDQLSTRGAGRATRNWKKFSGCAGFAPRIPPRLL